MLDLLAISYDFAPRVTPTALRTTQLLRRLSAHARITLITATPNDPNAALPGVERIVVPAAAAPGGPAWSRLSSLDPHWAWRTAATQAACAAADRQRPDAVLGFCMPYADGDVAARVAAHADAPLVLNFDDSPTCDDMHAYPTALHAAWARRLEDRLLRTADATVFVSQRTAERVRLRQPRDVAERVSVIRYGIDEHATPPADGPSTGTNSNPPNAFTAAYVGGMTGWYDALQPRSITDRARRLKRRLRTALTQRPGRLDHRGSSPVFLGRALRDAGAAAGLAPGLARLEVVGNRYPESLTQRVLLDHGVNGSVQINGPVPAADARRLMSNAELLFLALPARGVASPGGRISAKTYEYLDTDRPVLAAVPHGENRDYLQDWPGVVCVDPLDHAAMRIAVTPWIEAWCDEQPARYDRSPRRAQLGYDPKARALLQVVRSAITAHQHLAPPAMHVTPAETTAS